MDITAADLEFLRGVQEDLTDYNAQLSAVKLRDGLTKILSVSRRGNQYLQANAPWILLKGSDEDKKRADTVIGVAANVAFLLAVLLHPYMPSVSQEIRKQCGSDRLPRMPVEVLCYLKEGHKIGTPKPLFAKLESEDIENYKSRFGGQQNGTDSVKEDKPTREDKKRDGKSKTQKAEKKGNKGEKTTKEKMASVAYPKLLANSQNALNLLKVVGQQFEQRKAIFIREQIRNLQGECEKLKQEVDCQKKNLVDLEVAGGVRQIEVCHQKANQTNIPCAQIAPKEVENEQAKKEQPKKEQPKEMEKEKKKKEQPKKVGGAASAVVDAVDIGRLDLRIGRILDVNRHPDADSLYVETIDLGEEKPRTVVSGLVKHIPIDQMQNRLVMCLCNLKPAKMRGIESQAMVMCASSPEKVEIMEVDPTCVPGQIVKCGDFEHRPDAVLNPKKKVWEAVAEHLKVNSSGHAAYKDVALFVDGNSSPVVAPTLRGVFVK